MRSTDPLGQDGTPAEKGHTHMHSVSDPAPPPRAGSRGHRRGSRWFTGKFLVLFLAVATLLGGAALVAPQFQEKASAAGDNVAPRATSSPGETKFLEEVAWDIGNGNAGASRYTSMLNAVRQRASSSTFLHDNTHRTRPEASNEFFSVNISVQDEGTSTPSQIRVLIRASDLFVVGWLNQNENIYNRLEAGTPPLGTDVTARDTPFNGSYIDLERRAGDRANIPLSPNSARQAVRDLSRSGSSAAQQARGLIVLIQAISEAARFRPIENLFRNTYTTEAALPEGHILDLENSWDPMSEIANREVNNPNDQLTQELMRRHKSMLDKLQIFTPRNVLTLVLAIALFSPIK